jgi:chromosome segregation and condensation protein ScpB
MFRLFRRKKKKEEKEKPADVEKPQDILHEKTPSEETVHEPKIVEPGIIEPIIFEEPEKPFEEKFLEYTGLDLEIQPEEEPVISKQQTILPNIESIFNNNDSVFDFISPKTFVSEQSQIVQEEDVYYPILEEELPPISLEERIEGALFSVGRPIHANEIIESFDEESPVIKRAIRKLSRKRRRTAAISIHEISKDRWVMELNPIFHEFFQALEPEIFLEPDERRILTEIAYRQPISLALVKKIVTGIGPIKITEIAKRLENLGFIVGEIRARSTVYTSTSKFAKAFGFDFESRRLKLQMLWRLKRLMGEYEEDQEDIEEEPLEEETEDKVTEGVEETEDHKKKILEETEESIVTEEVEQEEGSYSDVSISEPPVNGTLEGESGIEEIIHQENIVSSKPEESDKIKDETSEISDQESIPRPPQEEISEIKPLDYKKKEHLEEE